MTSPHIWLTSHSPRPFPPGQDLSVLQSEIRDLSYYETSPAPLLPLVPAPTPQPQPPARPLPPTRKGKESAQAPPSPPPNTNEDPKFLIPYYDTKLGKAFGNPERYAQLFPHSYEASEFPRGVYDLPSFTPGYHHSHYISSPSYAQAASGAGSGGKTKKTSKLSLPQQVASAAAPPVKKGQPSLPRTQRHFIAPRLSPVPHPDAPAIAATFP